MMAKATSDPEKRSAASAETLDARPAKKSAVAKRRKRGLVHTKRRDAFRFEM